jgi:hypothetical protein
MSKIETVIPVASAEGIVFLEPKQQAQIFWLLFFNTGGNH